MSLKYVLLILQNDNDNDTFKHMDKSKEYQSYIYCQPSDNKLDFSPASV